MAVTVGGTSITFNDGTTQTTAAGGAPTTEQVLNATAGASVGAVGTYAFLGMAGQTTISTGSTYSGSSLRYAGVALNTTSSGSASWATGNTLDLQAYAPNGGGAPAGTWRAMGYSRGGSLGTCPPQYFAPATLFLRIS